MQKSDHFESIRPHWSPSPSQPPHPTGSTPSPKSTGTSQLRLSNPIKRWVSREHIGQQNLLVFVMTVQGDSISGYQYYCYDSYCGSVLPPRSPKKHMQVSPFFHFTLTNQWGREMESMTDISPTTHPECCMLRGNLKLVFTSSCPFKLNDFSRLRRVQLCLQWHCH